MPTLTLHSVRASVFVALQRPPPPPPPEGSLASAASASSRGAASSVGLIQGPDLQLGLASARPLPLPGRSFGGAALPGGASAPTPTPPAALVSKDGRIMWGAEELGALVDEEEDDGLQGRYDDGDDDAGSLYGVTAVGHGHGGGSGGNGAPGFSVVQHGGGGGAGHDNDDEDDDGVF